MDWKAFLREIQADSFPLFISMAYICCKIVIRSLCRAIASKDVNIMEIIAWFGVDLSFLAMGFSLAADLPHAAHFGHQGRIIWYFVLVFCILFTASTFCVYLKCESRVIAGVAISLGMVFGFGPFLAAMSLVG